MPSSGFTESQPADPQTVLQPLLRSSSGPGRLRPEPPATAHFETRLIDHRQRVVGLWHGCPHSLPDLGRRFSPERQFANERLTDRHLDRLEAMLKTVPALPFRRAAWRRRVQDQLETLAVSCFAMDRDQSRLVFNDSFFNVTRAFARRAKELSPDVRMLDLAQAWRNLWVMNLGQLLLDRPVVLTPSVFAYSMLYPYTDNPLDSDEVPERVKIAIGRRLEERLKGLPVTPCDDHEAVVFELIAMIESEYARHRHPEVFHSLLAIHRSQMAALGQQGGSALDSDRLLALSIAKGGTSVLADGYLIKPDLRSYEADFFFDYGVLLQLCDDLQDVTEDLKAGHLTLFSQAVSDGQALDLWICKLLHFTDAVLDGSKVFACPGGPDLKRLLRDNCRRLIVQAAGAQPRHTSDDFHRLLDRHSPISFGYLNAKASEAAGRSKQLRAKLSREKGIDSFFDLLA